ncbi:DEKNAAC101259 [Brettanomyces naardenensis]|uniref:glycerol kinase n=1 Tax=Brettanomyces naardenensis TaxID=13370 RepID=A0A448YHW5_BRENA|nr:DEKNAAC101259 [Brettanomyces naardenensis]
MSSYIPLICTVDVGTTSTRAILFTKEGEEVAKHQIEYSTSAQEGSRRNSPTIFSSEGVALNMKDSSLVIEDVPTNPTLLFPNPGWAECDPCHILNNVVQCMSECAMSLEILNSEVPLDDSAEDEHPQYKVVAIGIANMRETTIVWSKKTGVPLYNGIVWNDTRTTGLMNNIRKNTPQKTLDDILERSGCPLSTYFSCLKWMWLYQNVPPIRKSYESGTKDLAFGTVDSWLIYHLTHEHAFKTDITNASRTSFMNLDTHDYDPRLLKFWNVDPNKISLAEIVPSSHFFGTFEVPDVTKLDPKLKDLSSDQADCLKRMLNGVPITGCLGDQSASLVGQTAFQKGEAKCTYGTGAFMLYNVGTDKLISEHGSVTTVGYWFDSLNESVDGKNCNKPHYCLEGSIAVAGSCVQWLRDNLQLIDKASDIGPLAAAAPDSAGVVFVPAFSGLFAPYWDASSRGTIFGITQYSTAAHIARAAIEGVCFQVRAILKAMLSDCGSKTDFLDDSTDGASVSINTLHVDGGMSRSDVVMQIQADILGPCVSVERAPNAECTAFGAAIAAGLENHVHVWKSLKDVKKSVSVDNNQRNVFHAEMTDAERRKAWNLWERGVERARGWLNDK